MFDANVLKPATLERLHFLATQWKELREPNAWPIRIYPHNRAELYEMEDHGILTRCTGGRYMELTTFGRNLFRHLNIDQPAEDAQQNE